MVFQKLTKKFNRNRTTLFLGAPEAEAEALPNSKMPLRKVYKDHSNLAENLSNEKFIVVGRKGAGKSAFAEYICSLAEDDPNIFAKFIRQGETDLEQIVQIGREEGHEVERENLYLWLILTNVLKLFSDNQAVQNNNEYNLLKQFLAKNSGYVEIRDAQVKELIRKQGFEVNISYLKRFFTNKLNKSFEIRQEQAPFFKLIPHLKEVILEVLRSHEERTNGNSYILFFDDLDIRFSANDPRSIETLTSLLRVSKELNNEFFAKNEVNSKIVILLRDDIGKILATKSPDTAKLFGSYATTINWYQDDYHSGDDETSLNIRKFINDRIAYALKEAVLDCNDIDPWHSLVEDPFDPEDPQRKSSFKYVLDHTFFRPRDLLLFFKPLSEHEYEVPLSKKDVNHLIGRYCDEAIIEIKNELSNFYSSEQITTIFIAFGEMASEIGMGADRSISYNEAKKIVLRCCKDIDADELLLDLYSRSIVGGLAPNGFVFFKHREPTTNVYELNKSQDVILHSAVRIYCSNKGYS